MHTHEVTLPSNEAKAAAVCATVDSQKPLAPNEQGVGFRNLGNLEVVAAVFADLYSNHGGLDAHLRTPLRQTYLSK